MTTAQSYQFKLRDEKRMLEDIIGKLSADGAEPVTGSQIVRQLIRERHEQMFGLSAAYSPDQCRCECHNSGKEQCSMCANYHCNQ